MSKRDFGTIKSLLHFDYPYFAEPNDGLGDGVSSETWTRNGNTKLAGVEIPYEIEGSPKFGYRCAYFPDTTSYITGTNTSEIFNLSPDGEYEFEAFGKFSGTGGNMLKIGDLELSITNAGNITLLCQSWNINSTSNSVLTLDTWQHVLLRISGMNATVYIDGNEGMSASISGSTAIEPEDVRLGGFVGYMDEFVFRHSAGSGEPSIPSRPYSGTLNVNSVGGFGDGSAGDVTISEAGIIINSYSMISAVSNERVFTANSWAGSSASMPSVGSEIMIHITAPKSTATASYPYVGLYAFGRIAEIDGGNITLEEGISVENGYDFTLSSELLSDYYVQAITVPNYESLTVTDEGQTGGQIYAMSWNTSSGGGIVAFRCAGDCTVNGSILVHGYGAVRYDLQQMMHSKLIDRFLCAQGGGIFIACGGTLTASTETRLGRNAEGNSGYGGKGGSAKSISCLGYGGGGGVGGGGGGAAVVGNSGKSDGGSCGGNGGASASIGVGGGGGGCGGNGGSCYANTTAQGGGGGGGQGGSGGRGGAKGKSVAASYAGGAGTINGGNGGYNSAGGGGGAPGGNGGNSGGSIRGGIAGTCLILLCRKLAIRSANIVTNGSDGEGYSTNYYNGGGGGGGGTGFCYISCGEQVSVNA